MAEWSAWVGLTLIAIVSVLAPGAAICAILRLRGVPLIALAGPTTFAITGSGAVVAGFVGVRFGWWVVLGSTAVAALVAFAARRLLPYSPGRGRWDRGSLIVALAVVLSSVAVAVIAFSRVASPEYVSQTYDAVFHVNAVSWILDHGDASSFHLYRMTHPSDGIEFYPAGWHGAVAVLAQLTGASTAAATNAMWVAVNGTMFSAGVAYLAQSIVPLPRRATFVGAVAALASSTLAAFPYLLLYWGVLYPTGLAYALLPVGLALVVRLFRSRTWRPRLLLLLLAVIWLVAEVFAHPRSLPSFVVLAGPLALAVFGQWVARGLRDPHRRRRTSWTLIASTLAAAIALAIGSSIVLTYFRVGDRPIADRLNGGPATARQSVWEALRQALLLAPPAGPGETALTPAYIAAALTLVGLVVCLRFRRTRWIVLSYALVVVLYVLAAGSNDDLAKIATGLWYKDKFRLFALLGVLAPALMAIGIASVLEAIRTRLPSHANLRRGTRAIQGVAAVTLLTVALSGGSVRGIQSAITTNFDLRPEKQGALLDVSEYALLEKLPEKVPAGAVVVGNPWDGSVLTWALGQREALFPHLTGQWDPDRVTIATRLDQVSSDPEVCAALDRLDAHYLFASDGLLWGGDLQADFFAAISRAPSTPGFTKVESLGGSTLYRISACDQDSQ